MVLNKRPNWVHDRILSSLAEAETPAGLKISFRAMGTLCHITFCPPSRPAGGFFRQAVLEWVAHFEARYSRFIPQSLTSRINQNAGVAPVSLDPEARQLFKLCHELFFVTRGGFDPTSLPLIELWNGKADPPRVPSEAEIQAARELVGWPKVVLKSDSILLPQRGMGVDLGGIGKEYAVDQVIRLAQEHGIASALVDFGQAVRALGAPPDKLAWHIGLEDANDPGCCWSGVAARDVAVATSGDYQRKFELGGVRYGHIIDPRTGWPVANGCRGVNVIAPSCTSAGMLSTSAFLLGPEDGLKMIENYRGAAGAITTGTERYLTRRINEYLTH